MTVRGPKYPSWRRMDWAGLRQPSGTSDAGADGADGAGPSELPPVMRACRASHLAASTYGAGQYLPLAS